MPGIRILQVVCVYIKVAFVYSACTSGWYGSNCQYRCHCTNDLCDDNGRCVGDSRCVRGWFGQSCQYQDLVSRDTTIIPPDNAIADGDDTTCIQRRNASITWKFAYSISWLRVVLITYDPLKLLNITFMDNSNKIITCTDQAMLPVSETVTDILCNLNVTVLQVYLDFKENVPLCSVYIDGGRNVALKQHTVQSTDETYLGILYDSSRAVDGNPSGDFYGQKSCTHTQATPPSTWTVIFNQPRDVNRFVIYNRDSLQQRLKGFNLVSYNAQHIALFLYTDTNPSDTVLIYNVTNTGTRAVASVTITAKNVDNYLTLCEVEVYGYDSCPKGTYSIGCSSTCNCRDKSESCFVATGQCWSGCASGFQGEGCSRPCAETYYGEDCAQRCSTNCKGQLCNNVDGTCRSCPVGRDGTYCEHDCPATYFGENCRRRCSSTCLDRLCNNTDGLCVSCVVGRTGDFCEQDVECKTSNGSCSSNQQLGPLTSSGSDRLADGVGIGVGAMCGVVIIIVSVGCIVRKFRATSVRETGAHRKNNQRDVSALDQSPQTSHNKAKGNANTNLSCYDNFGVEETPAATYETISIHDV